MSYIQSPVSGRRIKVGGATYNKLMNEGVLSGRKSSPRRTKSLSRSPRSTRGTKSSPRKSSPRRSKSPGRRTGNKSPGCSNQGKYPEVAANDFCGPSGGACQGTFPVNTPGRARSALARAHFASNPQGIRNCVYRKAEQKGWVDIVNGKETIRTGSRSRSGSSSRSEMRTRSPRNYKKKCTSCSRKATVSRKRRGSKSKK